MNFNIGGTGGYGKQYSVYGLFKCDQSNTWLSFTSSYNNNLNVGQYSNCKTFWGLTNLKKVFSEGVKGGVGVKLLTGKCFIGVINFFHN